MRIKFLSIIASFFMVSCVITSCLDDDNNVEYSPDATIHAFALDTIGYGKTYKFTIDQLNREIYNEDSIPVHADTIVDRILIKTLTTASGLVTMKTHDGKLDSILNINDSIDLRKYINPKSSNDALKLTVYAPDGQQKKEYSISIRKHKHDPDLLRWQYVGNISNSSVVGEQKSILSNDNEILTYSVVGNQLNVYKTELINGVNTQEAKVNGLTQLPTSIINSNGTFYATSGDGNVYTSNNGIDWVSDPSFGNNVDLLLAVLGDKIAYTVNTDVNKRKFYTAEGGIHKEGEDVPDNFPIKNISYTIYQTATEQSSVLLVGQPKTRTSIGEDEKVETTIPWGYDGNKWVDFLPNNTSSYCPAFDNPSIIYYNKQYYIFGEGFSTIYASQNVIAWKKANNKFSFPYTDWAKNPPYTANDTPEFRGRTSYSYVLDPSKDYIWIIFSNKSATFKDKDDKEHTYNPNAVEIWRGRLNQLWFDSAKKSLINN